MSQSSMPPASDESSLPGTVELTHHSPEVAVVTMRGEHDLSTASQVARALERAAVHSDVLVDLSRCGFIDSTVIAALVKTALAAHEQGGRGHSRHSARVRERGPGGQDDAAGGAHSRPRLVRRGAREPRGEAATLGVGPGLVNAGEQPEAPPAATTHSIRVRDLRLRFGEPERYAAECACGWRGEERMGHAAERTARRDGTEHFDRSN